MWGRKKQRAADIVDFAPRLKPSTPDSRARWMLCEYEGAIGKIPYVVSCRDKGAGAYEFRLLAFQPARIQFSADLDLARSSDACNVALCLAQAVHMYGFKRTDEPAFWFWASLLASCVKVMVQERKKNETGNTGNT